MLSDIHAQLVKEGVEQDLSLLIQRARTFNEKKEKILATPIEVNGREGGAGAGDRHTSVCMQLTFGRYYI